MEVRRKLFSLMSIMFLILCTCMHPMEAAPVTDEQREVLELSLPFFEKYGYFEVGDIEPGKSPSETLGSDQYQRAVRTLQTYGGLNTTGIIDEETKELLLTPRCGNPDPPLPEEELFTDAPATLLPTASGNGDASSGGVSKAVSVRNRRYSVAGGNYKWKKNTLYYWIKSFPETRSNISQYTVRKDIREAFKVWSDVTPLIFVELIEDNNLVDIEISFGSRVHSSVFGDPVFDGPGGTLAHAFTPFSGWGETNGDIHFDDDEVYTHKTTKGVNLFYTAAHEIGHALGLDHSDVRSSLMWPWDKGYIPNFRLPLDDKLGIQEIYGKHPDAHLTSTTPPPTTTPPTKPPVIVPSYCNTTVDAVANIRGTLMVFLKDRLWRFRPRYNTNGFPDGSFPLVPVDHDVGIPTFQFFQGIKAGIKAVYERHDGRIIFLKARKKWVFDGTRLEEGPVRTTPEPKGYPRSVYAALSDEPSGLTYLFKGKKVWFYNEMNNGATTKTTIKRQFPGLHPSVKVNGAFTFYKNKFLLDGPDYYTADVNNNVPNAGRRNFGVDILGCPPMQEPQTH